MWPLASIKIYNKTLAQFFKFGLIGLSGMVIGLAILNLFMFSMHNFPLANIIAFIVAASWNFLLNRQFTFEKIKKTFFRQWLEFVIACLGGAVANWTVSMGLYFTWPFFFQHYNFAAIAGIIVGFSFNFLVSRFYVFRKIHTR